MLQLHYFVNHAASTEMSFQPAEGGQEERGKKESTLVSLEMIK